MPRFQSILSRIVILHIVAVIITSILMSVGLSWRAMFVVGGLLALVVLQMLESGFNLLGISSYLTMALWGAVLILFIALQNRKA